MDHVSDVSTWKTLLDQLESENGNQINYSEIIDRLSDLFQHLQPQTAPRLQKELESCTKRSEHMLGQLFDKLDLADKHLLLTLLKCLHAFGYFRLSQITYHIDKTIREDSNPIYSPAIEKIKWFDMEPLLPPAGTIGWKGIVNHCSVREEPELSQTCLRLLAQKLHFYSIASFLDRYRVCDVQIKRCGEKVAGKLFEVIRDVACEDERMVGLDEYIFNLLKPFTNEKQQAAIIDAIVQDLFKPFLTQRSIEEEEVTNLYKFINGCIMNEVHYQDIFISILLEHLKCNMIRIKRRHSVEPEMENGGITWKTIIDDINSGDKLQTVITKIEHIEISRKSLQTKYLDYWLQVINQILPHKTLTAPNAIKIIGICSFLVVKTSDNLCEKLSQTLAKVIEFTSQIRLDKLFASCSPSFLKNLTQITFSKHECTSDIPLVAFYKSYLNRYLKCCTLRVVNVESDDLIDFVTIICDNEICGSSSQTLQNICIQEISECMSNFKNRMSNKMMEVCLKCARMCSKRLHKFIKRNSSLKTAFRNGVEDEAEINESGNPDESLVEDEKRAFAISTLIFILKIAIIGNDQEILDQYGDLLLKLYKAVELSLEDVVDSVRSGKTNSRGPLDSYLAELTILYIDHKELVSPYIQHDLTEKLYNFLVQREKDCINVNRHSLDGRSGRKEIYLQIKGKLENLENQANNSSVDVYQAIINKQYSAVTDQSLGSSSEIMREEIPCTNGYRQRLHIVEQISATIAENLSSDMYHSFLNEVVTLLEECDPLDHPRFIYILSILQSLLPKYSPGSKQKARTSDPIKDVLPRISCGLIRLCKSVELGPSIHSYRRSSSHKSIGGLQCCTYASCIRIYTAIFQNCSPRIAPTYMTDAMQICISANLLQYAKHSSRLHVFFVHLASSIVDLMKSICMGRKEDEIVKCSMPIFLTVFSHLIRCIILASDRQKLETIPKHRPSSSITVDESISKPLRGDYEKKLELLAIDIGKCLTNVCNLRVKLVDHAPHLISTYIKDIQRASCPDHIKLHLNEGIFRVFNLVDAHQKERQGQILEAGIQRKTMAGRASGSLFEMIHARLDQASREIFRDMHSNHNKFHRYVGKC